MGQSDKKPIAASISVSGDKKNRSFKKKVRGDWKEFVEWLQEPFWRTVCLVVAILFSIAFCLPAIQNCKVVENYNGKSWYLFSQPDYVQAADAVMKGQTYLDIQASPELLALENPYDPGSREGVLYLWDHAFYNGHYYMYFGLTPVFTVYIPFYAVTHEMPNNVLACMILAIYCCITIPLAVFEWVRRFAPKTSPFLTGFASFVLVAVSGVYLHVSYSKQYQIPILSATAMGFLFCYLVLRALRCKKKNDRFTWKRYVLLALAGVSYVGTVASRPTMALMFLAPLPIVFFDILKPFKLKKAAKDLCALGIPVLIGAVLMMWYNYARFGNPLNFGQKYQLTVHEVSLYEMSAGMFGYAMIQYFFQMPSFDGKPPFPCRSLLQMDYGRYVYVDRSVGAFAFPTTLGTLFTAAVVSFKKDLGKTLSYLYIPVCAIALAFVDFCLAGVHLRYVFDIVPMLTFLGLLVWIELCKKATGKNKTVLVCVGIALCLAALYVSYGLVITHGGAGSQEPECLFHKI